MRERDKGIFGRQYTESELPLVQIPGSKVCLVSEQSPWARMAGAEMGWWCSDLRLREQAGHESFSAPGP